MLFETLQRLLGREAEPDWVQFLSFIVFVLRVLFRVGVRFLDSPLHAVTFAIYDFHIVEVESMLFEIVPFLPFDLIKTGATQTETSLLK